MYCYENSFDLKNALKWKQLWTQKIPSRGFLEHSLRTDVLEKIILKVRLEGHDHGLERSCPCERQGENE